MASLDRIEQLSCDRTILLLRLKDLTRICDAVRLSAGLGKHQVERLEAAKKLISDLEGSD
ncbi:hypothetical protein [Aquamicrobium defluvii]|uniref:Uncharacterized protein n=1 Tax=Aquamicrobium defluvii TaxID=69279 RepID=A0A4R6YES7_9HYPH|nr:hypothetical protein [Aquamicrobium defluvii]TDR34698.1 hypothetical protein DES43_113129 [Aquamicrobium defluvii]